MVDCIYFTDKDYLIGTSTKSFHSTDLYRTEDRVDQHDKNMGSVPSTPGNSSGSDLF